MTEELLPDPFRSENTAIRANAISGSHWWGLFEAFRLLISKVWREKENRRGVKEFQFKRRRRAIFIPLFLAIVTQVHGVNFNPSEFDLSCKCDCDKAREKIFYLQIIRM